MPAFLALATAQGPVMIERATLPVSKSASALVSSTLVERTFSLPSLASASAPLTEPGLLTMTLVGS